MLSARTSTTKGNLQEDIQHSQLPTISSANRINPGDKTTKVTTSTETDRRAFSARCKTTGRRSAAKGSRPKVNAADSNPTNSVEAPTFTFQDFQ